MLDNRIAYPNNRIVAIDRMRGLAVFTMIFFQLLERFDSLGVLSHIASHNPENGIQLMKGLMLADIGAPAFFFVISLRYIPSLKGRIERFGRKAAYSHFIMRYLAILGFGCCIRMIEIVFGGTNEIIVYICFGGAVLALVFGILLLISNFIKNKPEFGNICRTALLSILAVLGCVNIVISTWNLHNVFWLGTNHSYWGVLQSIGAAGLLMLLFAESGVITRLFSAGLLFGVFTFIHELPGGFMEKIDEDIQGGIIGVLAWCSMLLVFSVMADLYYRDLELKHSGKKGLSANTYFVGLVILVVLAVLGYMTFIINKGSVSPGYVLVNLPISSGLFAIFILIDKLEIRSRFLCWWGISPIFMYLLQYIFHDVIPSVVDGFMDLPFVPALAYVCVVTAFISWAGYLLYRNNKTIKF